MRNKLREVRKKDWHEKQFYCGNCWHSLWTNERGTDDAPKTVHDDCMRALSDGSARKLSPVWERRI